MTSDGSSAIRIVSFSRSSAHMPRVILRTVEPAKLLACQSVEKRCTRWNASARDVGHHAQRQLDDADEGEMAQHQSRRWPARSAPGRPPRHAFQAAASAARAARHRVDQPAGIERRQHVGQRRRQEGGHDDVSRTGCRRQWVKVKPRTLRNAPPRRSMRKRAMMCQASCADAILEKAGL